MEVSRGRLSQVRHSLSFSFAYSHPLARSHLAACSPHSLAFLPCCLFYTTYMLAATYSIPFISLPGLPIICLQSRSLAFDRLLHEGPLSLPWIILTVCPCCFSVYAIQMLTACHLMAKCPLIVLLITGHLLPIVVTSTKIAGNHHIFAQYLFVVSIRFCVVGASSMTLQFS